MFDFIVARIFRRTVPVAAPHGPKYGTLNKLNDLLHGVLGSPLSRCAIVPGSVRLEQLRNVRNQRVIGVGIGQQRANTQQNFTNRQSWAPLILENIETNTAVRVDVAVVNACGKMDFRRLQWNWFSGSNIIVSETAAKKYAVWKQITTYFEWIISGEMDIQKEDTPRIRGVFWSHDRRLPVEHVVADWTCGTV